ncbi:MAG: hypothetical protein ISS15_02895 [Alphaproteobacteria bacterium]|nr:hypothetical protein [Alphaproteobacteria bacterium]MBL7096581.1 hypothetical protein [Alphaproteobacteria bacterium]
MKIILVALAALIAVALAGCFPPSTSHPVGLTAGLKADPSLVGTWKGAGDDGKITYVHFLRQGDGSFSILLVATGDKAEDWSLVTGTTATLARHHFLNARLVSSNGKPEIGEPPGSMPLLYTLDAKGALTMRLMDEKVVKALIKAGKIKGDVGQGDMGDAAITADSRALDAFMQSPAALAAFSSKPLFVLHRAD